MICYFCVFLICAALFLQAFVCWRFWLDFCGFVAVFWAGGFGVGCSFGRAGDYSGCRVLRGIAGIVL